MIDIEGFRSYLYEEELAPNTIAAYVRGVIRFSEMFDEITKPNLIAFKQHLIENFKPQTVNNRITAVLRYCDFKEIPMKLKPVKMPKKTYVDNVIKSPFANISGLCCVHCDHKDEYIIELEEENQKLKQMLKKVADDAEGLFMGFAGYNPYEKRLKHEDCEAREYCDYCDRDCDCDGQCKWRYEDDVKKLLGLE